MIEIFPDGTTSCKIGLPYSHSGKVLGRIIMPITSRLRAYHALSWIIGNQSHLDIGCGDCLLLKKSPCQKRIGMDLRYGDRVIEKVDFPDLTFDNVTMLAVLEHLNKAEELLHDIHRVLTPQGRLIITTPRRSGEWLIKLYSKDTSDQSDNPHQDYYDLDKILRITAGLFECMNFNTFIFGMNQLFVLKKL